MTSNIESDTTTLLEIIASKDEEISKLRNALSKSDVGSTEDSLLQPNGLSSVEISRYSRQLIIPEIGVEGQIKLKNTAVLIVGAGGLGCPAAIYLSAAGIGSIGIVDHDVVDISNLHRQIAHKTHSIGENKSLSLKRFIEQNNPFVKCQIHNILLKSSNVEDIIKSYDIIVDASDNVPTRYLLNDAAVLFGKCLVSGAALRLEGQLTVYNYKDGPCYRCLFPTPPDSTNVANCSDSGILGAITGIIGSLQALEVIKLSAGLEPSYYKKMLIFDGFSGTFRTIKLRSKQADCVLCGTAPSLKELIDYELFCNQAATDKDENLSLLAENERISCSEYKHILDSRIKHILLDVRPLNMINICKLDNSINIPLNDLVHGNCEKLKKQLKNSDSLEHYVVCRKGNDSQRAVKVLQENFKGYIWKDIKGGLNAWHHEIDPNFPVY